MQVISMNLVQHLAVSVPSICWQIIYSRWFMLLTFLMLLTAFCRSSAASWLRADSARMRGWNSIQHRNPHPHATIYGSFINCDNGSSNSLGHFTPNCTQTTPNQSGIESTKGKKRCNEIVREEKGKPRNWNGLKVKRGSCHSRSTSCVCVCVRVCGVYVCVCGSRQSCLLLLLQFADIY